MHLLSKKLVLTAELGLGKLSEKPDSTVLQVGG
jgi:hypothetical protein